MYSKIILSTAMLSALNKTDFMRCGNFMLLVMRVLIVGKKAITISMSLAVYTTTIGNMNM